MKLAVNIGGIRMKNRVMPASGTFGYGEEYSDLVNLERLGAIVSKGITLEPRLGAPPPRIQEVTGGMINRIGLQNPGVEVFIKEKLPFLRQFATPVIVNINGETIENYERLAQRLDGVEYIDGLEINISCPNVAKGGMAFGQDAKVVFEVVSRVRQATSLPLITKLTPNVADIVSIAKATVDAGTDSLSLINTVKGRVKITKGPHAGQWLQGGLSGPVIKPIALSMVSEVVQANLGVPVIGMGGIMNIQDALEFLEAGANAIAIGTATFINPNTMEEVITGLEKVYAGEGD